MTKPIHGGVYLILGLGITVLSYYLLDKGQKMAIFFYAGIIMAAYGLIKLLIIRLTKERKPKDANARMVMPKQVPVKYCSRCGSQIRQQDQFCQFCGMKQY
ncbi:zinc ribbon domain-containing protein [Candidatus Woesearchaeota archaeon]|nr:zinc ribbon domain-containing protein [Candidatus Woesearchaeota archaeon]